MPKGFGSKTTGAKLGGKKVKLDRGTIREPSRSGRQGTGMKASRLRKGTIRSQNRYS